MTVELATVMTSGILGGAGIIIVALIRRNGNGKFCSEHSGLVANIENIQRDITEIKKDVKHLVAAREAP